MGPAMEKIDILEERVRLAVRHIELLTSRNEALMRNFRKLQQEHDLLTSENSQARQVLVEVEKLREERRITRQKCERLLAKFQKMNI